MAVLIQSVSIPRSGHHFLVRMLRTYFNANHKRMHYCEYYHCCKSKPCQLYDADSARPDELFLHKSHDEFLRLSDPDWEPVFEVSNEPKHLIQIRHPIPSTISDFELWRSKQPDPTQDEPNNDPNFKMTKPQTWEDFSVEQVLYRKAFLEKWILENPWVGTDQFLILNYDELIAEPREKVAEVIRFFFPNERIEPSQLENSMSEWPLKPRRNLSTFEHASTLDKLAELCDDTWQACQERLATLAK